LKFEPTPLAGAMLIEIERVEDDRGFFARSFCQEEFRRHGLDPQIVQCNVSWNRRRGTLRGLHYQAAPREEAKVVRCARGAIWDVIVDLRETSPTRFQWFGVELTGQSHRALYVPRGFAHGFQALADDTEVLYQMSEPYQPDLARGVRWDDPKLAVQWPLPDPILSERDRGYALLP
jgi:dTDP-4-dehydrorhamnose 3,5-epimerase